MLVVLARESSTREEGPAVLLEASVQIRPPQPNFFSHQQVPRTPLPLMNAGLPSNSLLHFLVNRGITLKGIHGVLEIIGGVWLWSIHPRQ